MSIDLPTLLRAYAIGLFPMSDGRDDPKIFWVEPERRAVLPLDGFHLSRSLRKTLRSERFSVTADQAFEDVVRLCAQSAEDRPATWINHEIERAFLALHRMGLAHSIECWGKGEGNSRVLLGGLYGLALGRAFFGESMVSRATDASKVALSALVARLSAGGFTLLDCQFMTSHLSSLGAIELNADDYSLLLGNAVAGVSFDDPLSGSADFFSLERGALDDVPDARPSIRTVSSPVSGQLIVQLLTQTS
ncbi:leucyl/phenylalanyl-tRNA--protein transferase [Sphingobium sp. CR28]|uniref:leucyl/phenylalanyl-tRNA--protein transferase n=1 Tax=Sphingobium sp. CR28 TaxID=3400272 RepID=UPI003FF0D0D1